MVDALIEKIASPPRPARRCNVAVRALDRVLRAKQIWVPNWSKPDYWVAYWDVFGRPDQLPPYARGDSIWWFDQAKYDKLKAEGARRADLMGAYVLRRLLLMVPTLFGILLVNFVLVQFMPGGPIEQIIAAAAGREPAHRPHHRRRRRRDRRRRRPRASTAAPRACRPSSSPSSRSSSASTSRPGSASC